MPRRVAVTASSPTSKPARRTTQSQPSHPHAAQADEDHASSPASSNEASVFRDNQSHPATSPSVKKPSKDPNAAAVKKVVRPPKYHEIKSFLAGESAAIPEVCAPWHLGHRAGETYRVAATLHRAAELAALQVRPVSWGYGTKDGALGHNNGQDLVCVLKRIAGFRHEYLRQVSAGDKLSLFLTSDGRVLQCGRLHLRQDGVKMWRPQELSFAEREEENTNEGGDEKVAVVHVKPVHEDSEPVKVVRVEAGHLAAYAIDGKGELFSWGTKRYGQLGNGDDTTIFEEVSAGEPLAGVEDGEKDPDPEDGSYANQDSDGEVSDEESDKPKQHPPDLVELWPRRIQSEATRDMRFVRVSAGNHFALALSSCGRVFSWGCNSHGQLGLGVEAPHRGVDSPHHIQHSLEPYVALDISGGQSHSLVIAMPRTQDASQLSQYTAYTMVFAFGCGKQGRLGIGGDADQREPVEVAYFRGLHATQVAAGHDHSLVRCAVGSRNYVYSFGGNAFGQLGIAQTTMTSSDMPMVVEELSGLTIATVGAGAYVSSALSGDGQVYTWGDSTHGKTARPDNRTTFVPWQVCSGDDTASSRVMLSDDSFVTQLSMGAHHSLALYRANGKADRWRKFPLEPVASYLHVDEGRQGSCRIVCNSSHSTKTTSVFGIVLHCETCGLSPVCRVCTRRCHIGHNLVPKRLHSTVDNNSVEALSVVHCACGRRRPPPPPSRVSSQKATRMAPTVVATPPNTKNEQASQEVIKDGTHDPTLQAPVYCTLATLPVPVMEDTLLR